MTQNEIPTDFPGSRIQCKDGTIISSGLTSNMPYMRQKAIRDMKLIVMEYDVNCGLLNLAQYQRLVSFQLYVN